MNHSSIGAIHGLDEEDGTRFLVLEMTNDESLEQQQRVDRSAAELKELAPGGG